MKKEPICSNKGFMLLIRNTWWFLLTILIVILLWQTFVNYGWLSLVTISAAILAFMVVLIAEVPKVWMRIKMRIECDLKLNENEIVSALSFLYAATAFASIHLVPWPWKWVSILMTVAFAGGSAFAMYAPRCFNGPDADEESIDTETP